MTLPLFSLSRIISICPLVGDGAIQMMAVTSTGIRIYFGDCLRIAHVRLPPRNVPTQTFIDPTQPQQPISAFALGDVK